MKTIIYLSIIFTLASCAITKQKYRYDISMVEPRESKELRYKDELIDIQFLFSEKRIGFSLNNLSNKGLIIDWDKVSIVWRGEANKVFHTNVKYSEKEKTQAPTSIPPKAVLVDEILPIDAAYFSKGYSYGGTYIPGKWKELNLFPEKKKTLKDEQKLKDRIGTTFGVYIPVEIGGEIREYNFVFRTDDIQLESYK